MCHCEKIPVYLRYLLALVIIGGISAGITLIEVYEPERDECGDKESECDFTCTLTYCVSCPSCNITCGEYAECREECRVLNSTVCAEQICPSPHRCVECENELLELDCKHVDTVTNVGIFCLILGIIVGFFTWILTCK